MDGDGFQAWKTVQEIADDLPYAGGNAEEICSSETSFFLPRTLYHLLIIYFALRDSERVERYPTFNNQIGLLLNEESLFR